MYVAESEGRTHTGIWQGTTMSEEYVGYEVLISLGIR